MNRRMILIGSAALSACSWVPLAAVAQSERYPSKPIKLIVGYPPGGSLDYLARTIAPKLADRLGVPVVVDNRAGAGGVIGAQALVNAAPDGYTLHLADIGAWAINPHLYTTLPYDPLKAFLPIGGLGHSYSMLVVSATVPAKDLHEFLTYTRQNPGKVSYGSYGSGSLSHLTAELFRTTASVNIVHVPYKGASQASLALMSGEVQMAFIGYTAAQSGVELGKLRILGLGSASKVAQFPSIPPIKEAVPGFDISATSFAIFAPQGTPKAIAERLGAELMAIGVLPDVVKSFASAGFTSAPTNAATLQADMVRDYESFGKIVKQSGARMN